MIGVLIKVVLLLFTFAFLSPARATTLSENICATFPGPAQTYRSSYEGRLSGKLWINEFAQIRGAKDFKLGFLGINEEGPKIGPETCEYEGKTGPCVHESELVVSIPTIPNFKESSSSLTISPGNVESVTENGYLDPVELKELVIRGVAVTLRSGEYWLDSLTTEASFDNAGNPLPPIITVEADRPVVLHVRNLTLNGQAQFNNQGSADNLLIVGHDYSSTFKLQAESEFKALVFNKGNVTLSGGTNLIGGVTADHLRVEGFSTIIGESRCFSPQYALEITPLNAATTTCSRIPVTFNITDDKGEVQNDISGNLTANATNFQSTACWAESQSGDCVGPKRTVALTEGTNQLWLQNKAIGTVNVTASFTSDETGELKSEDTGNYTFMAGGFRFKPSKLVAGKSETLSIEAFYGDCDTSAIPDYSGEKTLKIGDVRYVQPTSSGAAPPIKPEIGVTIDSMAQGEQTIKVTFDQGVATDVVQVSYDDAGVIALPLSEVVQSPDTGSPDVTETRPVNKTSSPALEGEALLSVRPYTFAICGSLPSLSDASNQKAFVRAGSPFTATLKPVVWQEGDLTGTTLTNGSVVPLNPSFCGRDPTPSFWHQNAPAATVTLDDTAYVVTPVNGSNAALNGVVPRGYDETNGANDINNVRYVFKNIAVDDVGEFGIRSKLAANYLGMTVNPGERELGRFYPSHFSVSGSLTPGILPVDDEKGKGFTYLNQPFEGQYTVYAMTVDNQRVRNYHLSESTATFEEWALHPSFARSGGFQDLTSRWYRPSARSVSGWQPDANGFSQYVFDGGMTINKESAPDGPFEDVVFAVGVAAPDSDKTDFRYCDAAGTTDCNEPVSSPDGTQYGAKFTDGDFFFGRMKLNGFAETQDFVSEQRLEVAIEYFNGQRFETNDRDNGSFISTQIGEKEVLVSDTDKDIDRAQILLRSDAGDIITKKNVKNGRSAFIVEPPKQNGAYNREQFRYWQRLDKGVVGIVPQTWLQHNWQGSQFDDDPSAMGTFGFYRGNDRVIYKGEKNITLTGE